MKTYNIPCTPRIKRVSFYVLGGAENFIESFPDPSKGLYLKNIIYLSNRPKTPLPTVLGEGPHPTSTTPDLKLSIQCGRPNIINGRQFFAVILE